MKHSRPAVIGATHVLAAPLVLAFQDGRILALLVSRGMPAASAGQLLGATRFLPIAISVLLMCCRRPPGVTRIGEGGIGLCFLGCIILSFAPASVGTAVVATVLIGTGSALFISCWNAILQPLLPPQRRLAFLAGLRLAWLAFGYLLGLALLVIHDPEHRWWPLVFAGLVGLRWLCFRTLPVQRQAAPTAVGSDWPTYLQILWPWLLIEFLTSGAAIGAQVGVAGNDVEASLWLGSWLVLGQLAGFGVALLLHPPLPWLWPALTTALLLALGEYAPLAVQSGLVALHGVGRSLFSLASTDALMQAMDGRDRGAWSRMHLICANSLIALSWVAHGSLAGISSIALLLPLSLTIIICALAAGRRCQA